jgi:DDE superfamily endonuclease
MEDVLDLDEAPADPERPLGCFDEMPDQLLSEPRPAQPAQPGQVARQDYEYGREGTANLFVHFAPRRGWRHVAVTARRTKADFAEQMRALVDEHFPDARRIRVVLDNLSTHTGAALDETFAPAEAWRIWRKLEVHYTPRHGSWLNQAEIELSVRSGQCLDRRIGDRATLARAIAAWEQQRNQAQATVHWRFTTAQARVKLQRVYPSHS